MTKLPIKTENWNDPDIVNTQLVIPKYYTSNPLITEFLDQWKKKVWEIMNHSDPMVQKDQLKDMIQCLEEMGEHTEDFLRKWKQIHPEIME
jgi:hypothetical protein